MTEGSRQLIMIVPEAHKAVGLAMCVSGLRVLTSSVGETVEPLRALGAHVVSVASSGEKHTTSGLLESPQGQAALRDWAPAPAVIFRPEHKVISALNALGVTPLCADPGVARRLENKRAFRALCVEHKLPVVRSIDMLWPPSRYIGDAIPWPRIVQTARGHAGKRSWFWETEDTLPEIPERLHGRDALVAPLVDGPTWTINGVVGSDNIVLGDVMRQIHGDPRLAAEPFSSAGVAFNPPGVDAVDEEVRSLADRIGQLAREAGFLGFFGIDAVGHPGGLRLVEMNARLTATLTAATLAEKAAGRTPLLEYHVNACLGLPSSVAPSRKTKTSCGGHLVVRQTADQHIAPMSLGTYRISGPRLEKVPNDGLWPGPGQVTVWPAGHEHGGPRDERLRLLFSSEMLDSDGRFSSTVESVLSAVLG